MDLFLRGINFYAPSLNLLPFDHQNISGLFIKDNQKRETLFR